MTKFKIKLDRILDIANDAPLTKRGILCVISRIYDPLGLMAPAVAELKFIFSGLCKSKYSWDSPLTDEIKARYSKWLSGLKDTSCINIPRCYAVIMKGRIQLNYMPFQTQVFSLLQGQFIYK